MKIQLRENSEEILDEEYLEYFHKNNLKVTHIELIGQGLNSETYKIVTPKREYALNIGGNISDTLYNLEIIEDLSYTYLPKIYDVTKIGTQYCIVMELLFPISDEEKDIIKSIDYLFEISEESGLEEWLEDNLHSDLYSEIESIIKKIDINSISDKEYVDKLKWFSKKYKQYEFFINEIQSAFQEYYEIFNTSYADFHGDNIMKDKKGYIKLIDL